MSFFGFGFKTEKQLATEKEPRLTRITNEILGPITEYFFEIKKKYHDELTQWRQDPDPLLDPMVSLKQYSDERMNLLSTSLIYEFKKFYIAVCDMKGNRINLEGVIECLQQNPSFLESYKNQLIIRVVDAFEMQFGHEAGLDKMFKIPGMVEHMVHNTFGLLSLYFIIKTNHPEHVIYILADIIWFIRNGSYEFRSISLEDSAVSDFFKSNPLYKKEHMHVGCIDAMQIAAPHLPRVSIKKTHVNFEEIFMGGHDKDKHNDVRRIQRFIALNHLLSFFGETGTTCKNVVYALSNIFVEHMFPSRVVPPTDHGDSRGGSYKGSHRDSSSDSSRKRRRSRGGRKIKTVRRHKTNKHNKSKSRRG
jgi:hypothetical protein